MKKLFLAVFSLITLHSNAQDLCDSLNVTFTQHGAVHFRLYSNIDSIGVSGATSFRWKAFPDSVFAQLDTSNYDFKTWLDSTNMSWDSGDSVPLLHFNWNAPSHIEKYGVFLFSFIRNGDTCVIPFTMSRSSAVWSMNPIPSSNSNAITQSTSCSATILNTYPNTVCWDPNFLGMEPDGGVTIQFTDTINIDTNYLSYVINPSLPFLFPFSSFWSYTSDSNTVLLYLYYLEGNNFDIIISYDDLSGYSCSDTVVVTIPDNATWNINGGFGGDVVCDNTSNGSVYGVIYDGEPPYYADMGSYSATSVGNNISFNNIPPGNYNVTVTDANNCSFTDYVEIIVSDPQINTSNDTICEGDSVTLSLDPNDDLVYSVFWPNLTANTYTFNPSQSGFHFFSTQHMNSFNSCYDSVYIEVLNNSTFSEVLTLCDSIVWNGVTYDSSGVYSDTLQNSLGCDSILILDVTFVQPTYGNETLTACDSVTWNGITYDSSGTFIDTIPNHLGCDSIVTIDVNLVGNYDMRFLVSPVSLIAPPFIFPFINATPNLVNYDFTWDFGDGTVIATNDTNITHEYQYNGVYTVKLIAEDMVNNCGVDTLEKVNLINCSGGPSLSIEEAYSNLVLYPNPARYVVNIDYGTEKDYSNHFVEIVNGI